MRKRELVLALCCVVANLTGALLVWDMVVAEPLRLGISEALDVPLGLLFGLSMGGVIADLARDWRRMGDDGENF